MSVPVEPRWQPCPEHVLTPYEALRAPGLASLLVLAPHPDDEIFGCGGLIALAAAHGARIQVVVVSDGAAGGEAALREQECQAAAQAIGYGGAPHTLTFWRLPDRGVQPDAALVARIVQAIGDRPPDWVLAPSPFEVHPDHRAVCLAALRACAAARAQLVFYEIGQPLLPNRLVDITPVIEAKQRAMRCFASQLAQQDYGEHVSALNRYRSYTLGPGVTHAEALQVVEPALLAGGLEAVLAQVRQQLDARFARVAPPPKGPATGWLRRGWQRLRQMLSPRRGDTSGRTPTAR